MPQDAFTLRHIARELDETLRGGRVNKIEQPSRDEVSLSIYTKRQTLKLLLNANASDCGAYFLESEENLPVAPNFCMLLRKHVAGAEILGAELVGFERVLRLRLLCRSDFSSKERELYLEVMGKYSNLVLVEDGSVLGALKTTPLDDVRKRAVFPGLPYVLPAPQDKANPADGEALSAVLAGAAGRDDLGDYLFTRLSGLAPCTARSLAAALTGDDPVGAAQRFLFSEETYPCVLERDGKPIDFFAVPVEGARPFPTLAAAQTYFYGARRKKKAFDGRAQRLFSAVRAARKKQEKRLAQIAEKQRECADCDTLRKKGELLTASLYALGKGMTSCELPDYFDEAGGLVRIALDPLLSPSENAQSYFKRYRKQKRTLEALAPQEEAAHAELDYLASVETALGGAECTDDLRSAEEELTEAGILRQPKEVRRGKKVPIPFRVYEREGFRILAGRNNLQNDALVRSGAPDDLWLHARGLHSCHVLIRTEGRRPPDSVVSFAAAVCARFSDGHGDRIPVDCCALRHVKKPKGAKAGFVTYTDFITVSGDPAHAAE